MLQSMLKTPLAQAMPRYRTAANCEYRTTGKVCGEYYCINSVKITALLSDLRRGVRAESCWAGIDVTVAASNDSAMGTFEFITPFNFLSSLMIIYMQGLRSSWSEFVTVVNCT